MRENTHAKPFGTIKRYCATICLLASVAALSFAADGDSDGVDDDLDNCSAVANPDQRDSDGDGFGNYCDTDLNNDNLTNVLDLALLRDEFGTPGPHADFNGDGIVNVLDLSFVRDYFGLPPGPGVIPIPVLTEVQAARFLSQATFGTTEEDISNLQSLNDFGAWLDEQESTPRSMLLPITRETYVANYDHCIADPPEWGCPDPISEILDTGNDYLRYAWWQQVVEGDDQLRQRMAYALSQILVVSDKSSDLSQTVFGLADYYDMLLEHSLGNYRDLLEAVTLHPVMGIYLSMARNEKPNPELNIRPDENYARELMQLLTIGVHELLPDGSLLLDENDQPIPSYDQATIQSFARVFTGWNFANLNWYDWQGYADKTQPMVAWEEFHDTDPKTLLNDVTLPGDQTAAEDLSDALDNVFNHPNVGPFIGSQLIKRLVTSNPTPAYVGRVAAVFDDNGNGVRGDLAAVVRAILLDEEARDNTAPTDTFGKLREPILRLSHLFRTFDATPRPGGDWDVPPTVNVYNSPANWSIRDIDNVAGQNVLGATSVFNFYRPDYAPQGVVADAGLTAPEFQIATENAVIGMSNLINFHIQDAQVGGYYTYLDFAAELALIDDRAALLDRLDTLLTSGSMSSALRQIVLSHLDNENFQDNAAGNLARVRDAVSLIVNSPEYLVQK